eukprot:13824009-Alexandrium_andersonii.AAC.1
METFATFEARQKATQLLAPADSRKSSLPASSQIGLAASAGAAAASSPSSSASSSSSSLAVAPSP